MKSVDSRAVGLQRCARLFGQPVILGLGGLTDAQGAHQDVRFQGGRPQHLGEPARMTRRLKSSCQVRSWACT